MADRTPTRLRGLGGRRRARDHQVGQDAAVKAVTEVVKAIPVGTPVNSSQLVALASRVVGNTYTAAPEAVIEAMVEQGLGVADPFGPATPLNPWQPDGTPPRQWNYPVGVNITTTPRTGRISFDTLKSIIDTYDVAQICIRHQVNDVRSLRLMFQPMDGVKEDVSADLEAARAFFKRPDGRHTLNGWLAMLITDMLRYDAPAIYRRRDKIGRVIAAEVVSGRTLIPLVDYQGRRPVGDAPAFVQNVTGLPWVWLKESDIIYEPLNPMVDSQYGLAPMEAVLLTANTDLRFQWYFLQHFTEGTIPDGFAEAPPDQSSPEAVQEWQTFWDAVMEGDQSQKHKVKWVPAGTKYVATKTDEWDDTFPLYLMRRVCAAFGVTPTDLGFTETVNKATSEAQADVQERVGRQPIITHVQDILDMILQDDLGLKVQARFDTEKDDEDSANVAKADQLYVEMGAASVDEIRRDRLGLEVDPEAMLPRFVMTPAGPVALSAIIAAAGQVDAATLAPDPSLTAEVEAPVELPAPKAAAAPAVDPEASLADQEPVEGAEPAPVKEAAAPAEQTDDDPLADAPDAEDHTDAAKVGKAVEPEAVEAARFMLLHHAARSTVTVAAPEPARVTKTLRNWRDQSRTRVARGQAPRRWDDVPAALADAVWKGLEHATDRDSVDAAFATSEVQKARPKA